MLGDGSLIETLLIDNFTPENNVTVINELESILKEFSATDKAIILAKEHYGYDYQEISELLNIPVPTLKSRVFRIRKSISKRGVD